MKLLLRDHPLSEGDEEKKNKNHLKEERWSSTQQSIILVITFQNQFSVIVQKLRFKVLAKVICERHAYASSKKNWFPRSCFIYGTS